MAATKISDVIVPEVFNDYVIQATTEKNAFIKSGIAVSDPSVSLTDGGKTVVIPFFKEIDANVEGLSDTNALAVNNISSDKDVAAIHARGIAFGCNDLAKLFSGADPMLAIAKQVTNIWDRDFQKVALASLKGIFGLASLRDSISDQSANVLDAKMMSDALFLLGDSYNKISAVAFHSKVLAHLKNLGLVDSVQPSTLEPGYYTYMEKRVIVDDSLTPVDGVYPIYFFGAGALSYNENNTLASVETDRDILAGNDVLTSRRVFTMHPRGVRWIGVPAGATPSLDELALSTNWELAENRKNVAISLLKAKLDV